MLQSLISLIIWTWNKFRYDQQNIDLLKFISLNYSQQNEYGYQSNIINSYIFNRTLLKIHSLISFITFINVRIFFFHFLSKPFSKWDENFVSIKTTSHSSFGVTFTIQNIVLGIVLQGIFFSNNLVKRSRQYETYSNQIKSYVDFWILKSKRVFFAI